MILVCPECGCTGDASAFAADGAYKEALALALKLPRDVQTALVPYLGLFRAEKRSLTGPRTLRLVRELGELVAAGDVVHDKRPSRPCPPALWAQGMRDMAERKGGQRAHFTNHNYLRALVYDLADKAGAKKEQAAVSGQRSAKTEPEEPSGLTDAAREALAALKGLSGKIGREMKP